MKKVALVVLALSLFLVTPLFAAITEETVIDKIEILRDGQIQIREATIIYRDGVEIAKTYQRHCLDVGEDISKEDKKVKDIANVVWTPEVRAARVAEKEKQKNK